MRSEATILGARAYFLGAKRRKFGQGPAIGPQISKRSGDI